jgi:hypothetical protein
MAGETTTPEQDRWSAEADAAYAESRARFRREVWFGYALIFAAVGGGYYFGSRPSTRSNPRALPPPRKGR